MAKKLTEKSLTSHQAWGLDQLAKSDFFHQKLHEWKLIEVAKQIEELRGEQFIWNQALLGITETAWNKIIHRGIKPIVIFAHPEVLQNIKGATAYYRMLAMVSQKSMGQISGAVIAYDTGLKQPDRETAELLTSHFNRIISHLIETDEKIDLREFDIWRGLTAGSQAQSSWQNAKGEPVEALFRNSTGG
jgi:hypothetical protein